MSRPGAGSLFAALTLALAGVLGACSGQGDAPGPAGGGVPADPVMPEAARANAGGGVDPAGAPAPLPLCDPGFTPETCTTFDALGALGCETSSFRRPVRGVISTAAAWEALWGRHASWWRSTPPPLPPVDFSREHVVFVALGERPASPWQVHLVGSVDPGGGRVVTVTERALGEGCSSLPAMTQPLAMLRIPAAGGPVRFVDLQQFCRCSR